MQILLTDKVNFAIIDDEDFELVNKYTWSIGTYGYARRNIYISKGKTTAISMHRLIMNAQKGQMVDHINGDKLDNRKSNLRFCNKAKNAMNCKVHKHNTSGYKGVAWHKQAKKWRAYIVLNDKQKSLGVFNSKEEAALAYNKAAIELFGEFAKVNIL